MDVPYAGLPKPGHAFFDAVGDATATQIRSPFFRRYLGVEVIRAPGAGHDCINGIARPRPVLVFTDLLHHDASAPAGLVRTGADEEPWVGCTRMLLARAEERRIVTVLPADQHLNPALLVPSATTPFKLDAARLLPHERAIVDADSALREKLRARTPLSVAEYQRIFGAILDKEDRNFIPHCREGIVEYIPEVVAAFDRQRAELRTVIAAGDDLATPWLIPDFKTGLSCLSAPDRRGLRGNALRDVLLASQRDQYLDGDARRHARIAIVGGTAHEYSVAELARFLVDLDYTVVLALSVIGGLGIASKRATTLDLLERYGTKLFATYDWPLPEFLGAAPPGFDALAAAVRTQDDEFHEAWMEDHRRRLERGCTSQGVSFVLDGAALSQRVFGGAP